jgi:hypothetical protein
MKKIDLILIFKIKIIIEIKLNKKNKIINSYKLLQIKKV